MNDTNKKILALFTTDNSLSSSQVHKSISEISLVTVKRRLSELVELDLLLQSYGRKEIAKRLGISVNTVQGYIKAIYLNFGVHSHAELLRHYFQTRGTEPMPPQAPPVLPMAKAVKAV